MNPFVLLIRRRAENAMMRRYGVSRKYVREVIANLEALMLKEISEDVWQRRAVAIAYRYPEDAAIVFDKSYGDGSSVDARVGR